MCVCVVVHVYMYLLDVPTQPTCMNGGYWELHQQLQSRLGARGANGTRASAHVTFQRTTSERKLCFSAKQSNRTYGFWPNFILSGSRRVARNGGPQPVRDREGQRLVLHTTDDLQLRFRIGKCSYIVWVAAA